MIIEIFLLFLLILLLIGVSPSLKLMNLMTILNSSIYLGFIIYLIVSGSTTANSIYFSDYILLDNLSLYAVLLVCIVFFLASIYSGGYIEHLVLTGELHKENLKIFYLSFNLLIIFTILTFCSNNLALFLIFAEITTFLTAVLIVSLNIKENIDAALKYIFITSTAIIFTFIGLVFLLAIAKSKGKATINWTELMSIASSLNSSLTTLTFIFIFFGFMAKAGIAPLHAWLSHTYSSAPSVVASVLSSVVSYIGLIGIIRVYAIAYKTNSWPILSLTLMIFGIVSMFIGSFSMIHQRNLKKVIAFSSSEQMGFMLIAISIGSGVIIYWLLFYMFIHALIKALLFFSAGILHRQYRSNEVFTMFNVLQLQPLASIGLMVGGVAILGVPPFGMFLPKFMILYQIAKQSQIIILIIVLFLLVIAISSFAIFGTQLFSNQLVHDFDSIKKFETPKLMQVPIILVSSFLLIIGFFIPIEIQNNLYSIVKLLHI